MDNKRPSFTRSNFNAFFCALKNDLQIQRFKNTCSIRDGLFPVDHCSLLPFYIQGVRELKLYGFQGTANQTIYYELMFHNPNMVFNVDRKLH